MPDRLPSLIVLLAFWIPPAIAGIGAANLVHRSAAAIRSTSIYIGLALVAVAWAAIWFRFNLHRMPPYIPGATMDPTYASPEATRGLAIVSSAFILPGSMIACSLAYHLRARFLSRMTATGRTA
jgi:hypothetical protein